MATRTDDADSPFAPPSVPAIATRRCRFRGASPSEPAPAMAQAAPNSTPATDTTGVATNQPCSATPIWAALTPPPTARKVGSPSALNSAMASGTDMVAMTIAAIRRVPRVRAMAKATVAAPAIVATIPHSQTSCGVQGSLMTSGGSRTTAPRTAMNSTAAPIAEVPMPAYARTRLVNGVAAAKDDWPMSRTAAAAINRRDPRSWPYLPQSTAVPTANVAAHKVPPAIRAPAPTRCARGASSLPTRRSPASANDPVATRRRARPAATRTSPSTEGVRGTASMRASNSTP